MDSWHLRQLPMMNRLDLGGCCNSLVAELGHKILLPGSQAFNSSLNSYYAQQESSILPLCNVRPEDTADVSSAISIISRVSEILDTNSDQDSHPECHFAVRSGGHGINTGSANIAGGVTIDLSSLNSVEIVSGNVAAVGPGATWDQVYSKLEPFRLSVAGGRNAGVGVGGLTTGEGISFFSPRYGWTCDTVLGYEVVLANGSAIYTSSAENPELLFALCGGSNNFSVVTRIDFQAFEQESLWGGLNMYDISNIEDHLRAFVSVAKADTYDEYASIILGFGFQPGDLGQPPAIMTNIEYTKPEEDPPALRAITSIPSVYSTMRIATMTELALELISWQPYGLQQLYAHTTYSLDLAILNDTCSRWHESIHAVQNVKNIAWGISLEPLPPCIYARGPAAKNPLGLADRSGTLVIALLTATWKDPNDDAMVEAAALELMTLVEADAKRRGVHDPFVYLNYAAPWQKPIESYGADSVRKLREIRQAVDPRGLFTHGVPGGGKIPHA